MNDKLVKMATLGGRVNLNTKTKNYYFGDSEANGNFSKEKLFGISGPLLPGMPDKHRLALEAVGGDTRQDLIEELTRTGQFTKQEADLVIGELIQEGYLLEAKHPTLGKILVRS